MAHFKNKRSRTAVSGRYSARGLEYRLGPKIEFPDRFNNWPRWHDKLYHIRPRRHQTKRLEKEVLNGADTEGLIWPDDHKPHEYYW